MMIRPCCPRPRVRSTRRYARGPRSRSARRFAAERSVRARRLVPAPASAAARHARSSSSGAAVARADTRAGRGPTSGIRRALQRRTTIRWRRAWRRARPDRAARPARRRAHARGCGLGPGTVLGSMSSRSRQAHADAALEPHGYPLIQPVSHARTVEQGDRVDPKGIPVAMRCELHERPPPRPGARCRGVCPRRGWRRLRH